MTFYKAFGVQIPNYNTVFIVDTFNFITLIMYMYS